MWQEGLKFKYQINEVLSKEFFSVPMGSGISQFNISVIHWALSSYPKIQALRIFNNRQDDAKSKLFV